MPEGPDSGEHTNAAALARFYHAFAGGDAATMTALYAPDATFSDPAFGTLRGPEVVAMWTMLCAQATDLDVEARDVRADAETGSARWRATYTFTATGRPVVNEVAARFRFRDGRVVEHHDAFSLWRWARQALGPAALALGSNPLGHALIRRRARGRLEAYMAGQRGG